MTQLLMLGALVITSAPEAIDILALSTKNVRIRNYCGTKH